MIVPAQVVGIEGNAVWVFCGPFNAGDECTPFGVFAFPGLSWQLTGYAGAGNDPATHPNIEVMADRAVTVYGSNDPTNAPAGAPPRPFCWSPVFTINADPQGMDSRLGDPRRVGNFDQRFRYLKAVAEGTPNPAGPDCGLMLLAYRVLGPVTL